jgi:hypothetical protein
MRDIEKFLKERPTATQFDEELFLDGWAAGVQYARRTICTEDRAGSSCNPPDQNSIADASGNVTPPRWPEPPRLPAYIVKRMRKLRLGLNRRVLNAH